MKYLKEWSVFDEMPDDLPPNTIIDINPGEVTLPTGKVGVIHATYDELVKKLGAPHIYGPDEGDKTQVEWFITFLDKTSCTIYDYKAGMPYQQVDSWSIGGAEDYGKHSIVVDHVQANFPDNKVMDPKEEMDNIMNLLRKKYPSANI